MKWGGIGRKPVKATYFLVLARCKLLVSLRTAHWPASERARPDLRRLCDNRPRPLAGVTGDVGLAE